MSLASRLVYPFLSFGRRTLLEPRCALILARTLPSRACTVSAPLFPQSSLGPVFGVKCAFAWRDRVKRRTLGVDHGHERQYLTPTRVQAPPPPSRVATTFATGATTKRGRAFDDSCQDCCEVKKCRNSEARADRVGESCDGKALAGVTPAGNSETRQRRRRHRRFLSSEKWTESIPKLTLFPQTVSELVRTLENVITSMAGPSGYGCVSDRRIPALQADLRA